jgi:hypothetical protein
MIEKQCLLEEYGETMKEGDLIETNYHYGIAKKFVYRYYTVDHKITIYFSKRDFFIKDNSEWRVMEKNALRAKLYRYLDSCTKKNSKGEIVKVNPNTGMVSGIITALKYLVYVENQIGVIT